MSPNEQPRNEDGTPRDVPPPPYEQHTRDQRPQPHQIQQVGGGYSAPELAPYGQRVSNGGEAFDPNGRRRSEAIRRGPEFVGNGGYAGGNGGQRVWGQEGMGMGRVQDRRGSGDGKKDCVIM